MASTLDLRPEGRWFEPSPCHRVVSSERKLYPTLSLSTQVYKMGTVDIRAMSQLLQGLL